ncbi:MAG: hypothetical protein IT225_08425 [Flavobacteriales bacterium]|nr:hypothetical protein [Flavobacteriales bacterium]
MMEIVSDRVSIDRSADRISVVISARLTKRKEALLIAWFLCWLLIGTYVLYARTNMPSGDPLRQFLLVFLAFWLYFVVRVGRALLWRLKGFEQWRLKDGVLTLKDSILGFGKANTYFVENIQRLGALNLDPTSFKHQLNDSFWTVGGERLGFEHLGRKVAFGKGLTEAEAKRVLFVLQEALRTARKRVADQ